MNSSTLADKTTSLYNNNKIWLVSDLLIKRNAKTIEECSQTSKTEKKMCSYVNRAERHLKT